VGTVFGNGDEVIGRQYDHGVALEAHPFLVFPDAQGWRVAILRCTISRAPPYVSDGNRCNFIRSLAAGPAVPRQLKTAFVPSAGEHAFKKLD
jgi:hypothetical protein